jgi:NADPH-dependent ferric siderophore reductase
VLYAPLTVAAVTELGPRMRRVTFAGDELAAWESVAPDQQVKLFFARDGGVPRVPDPPADRSDVPEWYRRYLAMPEPERPWMRSYTVRRHLPEQQQVEIDFVLHEGSSGPASAWAAVAAPGDVIGLYGPAVAHFRPAPPGAVQLLAGDETALPAIAALLETLAPSLRATVHVQVTDAADEQELTTDGDVAVHWHHRGSTSLIDGVRAAGMPDGLEHGWLAGEASEVRALRRLLVDDWGMAKSAVGFTGYWRRHLSQDDAPTAEDTADAAEAMADASS